LVLGFRLIWALGLERIPSHERYGFAIRLSSQDSLENIILQKDRSTFFLVYGSGSDSGAIVCRELIKKGFLHVYLLSQGFTILSGPLPTLKTARPEKNF